MAIQDLKNGLVIGGQLDATFQAILASNEPDAKRSILVEFMDACVVAAWNAQQARIDALMLEYCPEDMTAEQKDEWGRHQRAVEPSVTLQTLTRKSYNSYLVKVDGKFFPIQLPGNQSAVVTALEILTAASTPVNYTLFMRVPGQPDRQLHDTEPVRLYGDKAPEFYAVPPAYSGGRREI